MCYMDKKRSKSKEHYKLAIGVRGAVVGTRVLSGEGEYGIYISVKIVELLVCSQRNLDLAS